MKNIIQFQISKGEKYYVAEGISVPIVTQAKTLDKLTENIKEAVSLHFRGQSLKNREFSSTPSIFLSFELPTRIYA
jgi:predicted RNase H-like HicB family nuclease